MQNNIIFLMTLMVVAVKVTKSSDSSNIANFLTAWQPPSDASTFDDAASYPYPPAERQIHGSISVPPSSLGVTITGQKLLLPQLEVLRLIEAFLKLKGELINRAYALVNDNYDLIRTVINLVLGKLSSLHAFSLKGITVLRRIIEFSLNLFSDWSVNLPSLSVGASVGSYPALPPVPHLPHVLHDSYGVPVEEDPVGFFDR